METLANKIDIKTIPAISDITKQGSLTHIPISKIRLNPKNYRKVFDEKALSELAEQLKQHGILSSLMLRPASKGTFEVVVGERRFRAAKIAGLKEVPARVVELTDDQVLEVQLDENMQRENPHPLDESAAIRLMLDAGMSIEEISLRLGKSKGLIYNRIKLSELIQPIQEMFMSNILTLQAAIEISELSIESQEQFFERSCKKWKTEGFNLRGLSDQLRAFKFNLQNAPFDTKDTTLFEDAGACSNCPYNSETLKSLFPEMTKGAICSNISCYKTKSTVSLERSIKLITQSNSPQILITAYNPTSIEEAVLQKFPALLELPRKSSYEVNTCKMPSPPKKKDFQKTTKESGEKVFDEKGFMQAMEEFKTKMDEFKVRLETGKIKSGLYLNTNTANLVYYHAVKFGNTSDGPTAKEVQQAIKEGNATPELLKQEIVRLEAREKRAKELDREKVQLSVHTAFSEQNRELKTIKALTKADQASAKWIIFLALGYKEKEMAIKQLFPQLKNFYQLDMDKKFQEISKLSDKQFAYMIRLVLVGMPDSKQPRFDTSYFLYQDALESGIDLQTIEQEQQEKAKVREERTKERIKDLQKQIKALAKKSK